MGMWGHQRWSVYPHHVRPGPWEETLRGKDKVKYRAELASYPGPRPASQRREAGRGPGYEARAEHIMQSIDLVHRVDGSWCGGGRRVERGGGEGGEVWFSSGRGWNI